MNVHNHGKSAKKPSRDRRQRNGNRRTIGIDKIRAADEEGQIYKGAEGKAEIVQYSPDIVTGMARI